MRIEAYNQVAGLYKASNTSKTSKASGISGKDEVQISRTGRDFQIAKQAVAASPDIREDKVAELKARIDSGEYQVTTEDFAAKLMGNFNLYA